MPTSFYKSHLTAVVHLDCVVNETLPATVTAGEITFEDVHFVA